MKRDNDRFGNVLDLGIGPRPDQIINELRGYWEGLRRGRLVPSRTDVDPRGIERALEYAFILERVAPGMGRFRLAGMHLNDLMGMEVRGMPLTALFAPAGRKRIAEITEAMFQEPAVVEVELRAETMIGKPEMTAKLLILPLQSDLGDVTRALGCLIATGEIGRTPRRFEVAAATVTPIKPGAPTPREPPAPPRPQALGFAEAPEGFEPLFPHLTRGRRADDRPAQALSPDERRAMFKLVKSDS